MQIPTVDKKLLYCLTIPVFTEHFSDNDWLELIEKSANHGITPLLYRHIKRLESADQIPAAAWATLQGYYYRNLRANIRHYADLKRYLMAFADKGIPVVVLKGAHLAETIYDNIGMRVFNDIDLLVKRKHLKPAQELIQDVRDKIGEPYIGVDLHWYIEEYRDIPMASVWKRVKEIEISEKKAFALSPEALLVHLCMHTSFHHLYAYYTLRTLFDINEILDKTGSSFSWDEVINCAREWGALRCVGLTLLLAKDLTSAPIPQKIFETLIPDGVAPELKTWAINQIFQNSLDEAPSLSPHFWQLFQPASFFKKIGSLKKILFPPSEFVAQRYATLSGTMKTKFYYLVRLKDHLFRYASVIFRLICREKLMVNQLKQVRRDYQAREWLGASNSHPQISQVGADSGDQGSDFRELRSGGGGQRSEVGDLRTEVGDQPT